MAPVVIFSPISSILFMISSASASASSPLLPSASCSYFTVAMTADLSFMSTPLINSTFTIPQKILNSEQPMIK